MGFNGSLPLSHKIHCLSLAPRTKIQLKERSQNFVSITLPEQNQDVKSVVQKITDLPALPTMLATLNRLMADPRTSADTLGKALGSDPALVSKVLKLVNSAFYGFPGRIGTISQAVVILGFSSIRNLVLTTSVMQMFGTKGQKQGFDVEAFWRHSLQTAALARQLAFEKGQAYIEEAFIGGLLHDMGRMVLSQKLPVEFEKVLALSAGKKIPLREAEFLLLGTTHAEIGSWLAQKWNLPPPLIDVIQYHHTPQLAPVREAPNGRESAEHLVSLVHVSDELSDFVANGRLDWAKVMVQNPSLVSLTGLSEEDGIRFAERAVEEIARSLAFLDP
jgi:putative nucleotidyltransferase with HDIG domain